MSENVLRKRKVERHEDGRPYNRMESYDLLAYEVYTRPVLVKQLCIVRISKRCDIVCERIEPHVYYMLFIDRHLYSPVK